MVETTRTVGSDVDGDGIPDVIERTRVTEIDTTGDGVADVVEVEESEATLMAGSAALGADEADDAAGEVEPGDG